MTAGRSRALNLLITSLLVFVLILTAYVDDDSFITFRSVANFLDGYGLRFNVDERVQTFTNPLWALIHIPAAFVTGEFYYTTIVLSFIATCAMIALAHRAFDASAYLVFVAILITSKSFIDFSSSGLENPLSHLLVFAMLIVSFGDRGDPGRRSSRAALLASLLVTNRQDLVLICAPLLLVLCVDEHDLRRSTRNVAKAFLWGSPILVWLAFCLFYYGSIFPNTAHAKIWNTGIPAHEFLERGLGYYRLTLRLDPFSLAVIAIGIGISIWNRERRSISVALGSVAYLVYVALHGADQMVPRSFSTLTVVAAFMIGRLFTRWGAEIGETTRLGPHRSRAIAWTLAGLVAANLALPWVPLKCLSPDYFLDDPERQTYRGMKDHRAIWIWHRLVNQKFGEEKFPIEQLEEDEIRVAGSIGIDSFQRGPRSHTLDYFALGDPLLSRIPSAFPGWIPGHIRRNIPYGYIESIYFDENRIEDPNLKIYYEAIRTITRGDLCDPKRLKTLVEFNLGRYDEYLHAYDPRGGINAYKQEQFEAFEVRHLDPYDPRFKALINFTVVPKKRP